MPSINNTVLMSDALHFTNEQAINPYYGDTKASAKLAQQEHSAIKTALKEAGVTVIEVPSPTNSQDGVYTANWALVRGDKAIISRLPTVRKAEEAHATAILSSLGKQIIYVPEHLKFSGQGDALPCGDLLFCGQGYRSDLEAQEFAARELGFTRIQLQTIPELDASGIPVINAVSGWADSFFYDIDLALAVIRHPSDTQKGLIAYCPQAFTKESQYILETIDSVEKITLSLEEAQSAFATNLVSTGDVIVMSDKAPVFKNILQKLGYTVVTPHVSELAKGGGYIRCTTLSLD
jgi:N-dimethylarginine dimethylaminohydrolase